VAGHTTQDQHHRQAAGERDGFEHVDELTCWALLASTPVGRVGVVVDGAAEIYPVNHVVDRHPNGALTVVFRTDPGTKLAGLAGTPGVCFEVDGVDPDHHSGWSVLVKGQARQVRELADPDERDRVEHLTVGTWDPGPKRHWIRIEPTEVTGRRIGPLPALPHIRTIPAFAERTHGELPSVADWSEREVWMPPPPAGGTTP
jgi:nitroimidazol reductase NimA-like FMN-containing flavoprotein (pyridoxamine 5'-phosphate oxidase superfamily)